MAMIFSANRSKVQVDGDVVEGLQTLAFKVVTAKQDVPAVGSNERVDVIFGLRTVQGELIIRSASVALDTLLQDRAKFQLVAICLYGI